MELRWLDDFIALAKLQHFSRAAEQRHVTQPTFSRRIKLLEEAVGVTLIDRNTLPLSLTPAGKIFLDSAEQVSAILRQANRDCQEIQQRESDRLSFATTQSLYVSWYRSWLQPLAADLGIEMDLNLQSTAWSASDFVTALQQSEVDMVLCYWHPDMDSLPALDTENFVHVCIAQDQLVPVSVTDGDGNALFQLPGSRRQPLPYIAYHNSSFMHSLLQTIFNAMPAPHLVTLNENRHAVSVLAMIREGFGLGWVPKRLVKSELDTGALCLAGGDEWFSPLELRLYRRRELVKQNLIQFWQGLLVNK